MSIKYIYVILGKAGRVIFSKTYSSKRCVKKYLVFWTNLFRLIIKTDLRKPRQKKSFLELGASSQNKSCKNWRAFNFLAKRLEVNICYSLELKNGFEKYDPTPAKNPH